MKRRDAEDGLLEASDSAPYHFHGTILSSVLGCITISIQLEGRSYFYGVPTSVPFST